MANTNGLLDRLYRGRQSPSILCGYSWLRIDLQRFLVTFVLKSVYHHKAL
jgi:hypothetical protein